MIPLWAILAITGAVLLGFSNVLDKAILNKYLNSKELVMIYVFRIILVIPFLFFFKLQFDFFSGIFYFALGIVYMTAVFFYARALKTEEVSRVTPMFSATPLIVMILSVIFFNEIFTRTVYLGIALVALGVLLLSYRLKKREHFNMKTAAIALASAFMYAVIAILIKYATTPEKLPLLFFWFVLGSTLASGMFWFQKDERKELLRKFNRKLLIPLLITTQITTLISYLASIAAISLGPVTLATTLYATTPLFVLIFATLSTIFFRKFVKEDICRFTVIQKIVAIAMVLAGVALVT